jgi:glyoxylase-like metal-dependent hydrolase (beta-lactamase superfamily II)
VAGAIADGVAGAGLDPADLAWIVVTHIHLDHAGGVGDLVRTFPNATVVVHPAGARHLVDPARLLASSARVYGPLMETVYGGLTPVEASRIKAAEDGEVIDLGGRRLELLHAPGHAKHHLAVFEPDQGTLFAGDGVGVLLPRTACSARRRRRRLRPRPRRGQPSPVRRTQPGHLVLTHFGPITPPADRLPRPRTSCCAGARQPRQAAKEHGAELDHIEAALRERFEREEGHHAADPNGSSSSTATSPTPPASSAGSSNASSVRRGVAAGWWSRACGGSGDGLRGGSAVAARVPRAGDRAGGV